MTFSKHIPLVLIFSIYLVACSRIGQDEQLVTASVVKDWGCTKYPNFPIVLEACEVEGPCGKSSDNKVLAVTSVYEQPFKTSKIIDRLEPGDKIREVRPYLVIKKLGAVKVVTIGEELSDLGVHEGDIGPYIKHMDADEHFGGIELCVGDKIVEVDDLEEGSTNFVKVITEKQSEDWVKLITPRGKIGYTPDISEPGSVQWYSRW